MQAPTAHPTRAALPLPLSQPGWPRWPSMLFLPRRALEALILAALIFILAALAGPHLVEHLLGAGGDPDHCAVCAALHGARSGVAIAPAAPLPGLPVVGSPPLQLPLSAPVVPVAASSSRAPPLAA